MALSLIERNFAEQISAIPEVAGAVSEVTATAGIQWIFSFLSAEKKKPYCLYEAPNPDAIREAARKLNIPADVIVELGESRIMPTGLLTPTAGGRSSRASLTSDFIRVLPAAMRSSL